MPSDGSREPNTRRGIVPRIVRVWILFHSPKDTTHVEAQEGLGGQSGNVASGGCLTTLRLIGRDPREAPTASVAAASCTAPHRFSGLSPNHSIRPQREHINVNADRFAQSKPTKVKPAVFS